MTQSLNKVLRERMQRGKGLLLPGAANALAARVIEACGFDGVFITGAGVANTYLGTPDVGLLTLNEIVDHVWKISDSVSLPIVADADTGFGNVVNVNRTIRMFERAGANGVMLEDQVSPKRCGHFEGKQVVPTGEMLEKIKAAVDARHDNDLMIVARTDVRAIEGMQAAIDRGNAFREAGADVIFVEAPISLEELAAIPAGIPGPHICNMVIGGKTPTPPQKELAAMGYAGIYYANAALQASLYGMKKVLTALHDQGSVAGVEDEIISFADRQKFVNHDYYQALEKKYV